MKRRGSFVAKTIRDGLLEKTMKNLYGTKSNPGMEKTETEDAKPQFPYNVEEILNQTYLNRQEDPLAADIFKPEVEKDKEMPVIVTIHGGGLVEGDRKITRDFNRALAGHGYLVFSVEYRLAPRANCAQQLDDVCAGMDLIGRELVSYNVDFSRIYLIAESAGAYLATYVTAMKYSEKLQKAIGYEPSKMIFKAVGLISGMFYTRKKDLIGYLLSAMFFGKMEESTEFIKYMNPENPEIIDNLPPAYLITSRGDFLNNYTLMFHDALKRQGKKTHLLYYGDKNLGHSFVSIYPYHEKSEDAIQKMLAWFEDQAVGEKVTPEEETAPESEKPEETAAAEPDKVGETAAEPEKPEEDAAPEPEKSEEDAAPESEKSEEESEGEKSVEESEAEKKPKRNRKKKTEAGNNKSQS
ncbi:MAG: alpha/beta hydrolase fold domain-containing protein [Lachnospiraceae bacterium]|nr:alpha/beta hydrolase fold domain-containing protein [Lachnospiraceae bacterium]